MHIWCICPEKVLNVVDLYGINSPKYTSPMDFYTSKQSFFTPATRSQHQDDITPQKFNIDTKKKTIFERSHHLQSIILGIQPVTFRGPVHVCMFRWPTHHTQKGTQKAASKHFFRAVGWTLGILVMTEIFWNTSYLVIFLDFVVLWFSRWWQLKYFFGGIFTPKIPFWGEEIRSKLTNSYFSNGGLRSQLLTLPKFNMEPENGTLA